MKHPADLSFLGHRTEMSQLIRQHDWSLSPLGFPDTWPQSLRSTVGLMLESKIPMFLIWGPMMTNLYNDAYAPVLGARHPNALGRPLFETWPEIWTTIEPLIERAFSGEASYFENLPFNMERKGYPEQTYFTFSYSPIRDESGAIAGMFCACTETTSHVYAQQRQAFQLALTELLRDVAEPMEILRRATKLVGKTLGIRGAHFRRFDTEPQSVAFHNVFDQRRSRLADPGAVATPLEKEAIHTLQAGVLWHTNGRDASILSPEGIPAAASVAIPVLRQSSMEAVLLLEHGAPRHWTSHELTLAEDCAERTWGAFERAQAEQERQKAKEELSRQQIAEGERLRRLFDKAPGFVAVLKGPDHVFDFVNMPYLALVGNRDLIGLPGREALPEAAEQGFFELLDEVYATGKPYYNYEASIYLQRHPDEPVALAYCDFVYQPIVEHDGSVSGIFVAGYDVTERKVAQDALRTSEERWKLAFEATGDSVWDWNQPTGRLIFSDGLREMLGYEEGELGNYLPDWQGLIHPGDAARVRREFQACMRGIAATIHSECRLRHKDGRWIWVLNRGAVVSRNSQGGAVRIVGTQTDISDRKRSEQEAWERANLDPLTSLPNRRLFREKLDQLTTQIQGRRANAALLFIDLDRFKEVNDLLGHDAGDLLLKEAAERICSCVTSNDMVARLGGDEFTVILQDVGHDEAQVEQTAQEILAGLAAPFVIKNEVVYVSGSIGITLCPRDGEDPEDLVRNADQAMYLAKKAGRNQFGFFQPEMQESTLARLKLLNELRMALPRQQLQLFFQPIVEMGSARIIKAEALLRWNHPERGLVQPGEFISLAEETGLIKEIGHWIFGEAGQLARRWSDLLGHTFQISINMSPVQFTDQKLIHAWPAQLAETGLPDDALSIEITESVLLNASPQIAEQLAILQQAGISVAIDDFGTGYSSLAYLKRFDVNYLKIDQSFVRDMATSTSSQTIAETIIVMAHKLGLKAIAEGVETREQHRMLLEAGCDFGQGFLYAHPLPAEEFEQLILPAAAGRPGSQRTRRLCADLGAV